MNFCACLVYLSREQPLSGVTDALEESGSSGAASYSEQISHLLVGHERSPF